MRRGFTLIEVILALALLALVLSLVQGAYTGAVKSRNRSGEETARVHEAALLLDRMVLELAGAFSSPSRTSGTGLAVKRDSDGNSSLYFTTVLPPLPAANRPGGEVVLRYRLEPDEDRVVQLARYESQKVGERLQDEGSSRVDRDDPSQRVDRFVREPTRFRVQCLSDVQGGSQWSEEWDSTQRLGQSVLPVAVRIEIGWRVGEKEERVLRTAAPVYGSAKKSSTQTATPISGAEETGTESSGGSGSGTAAPTTQAGSAAGQSVGGATSGAGTRSGSR